MKKIVFLAQKWGKTKLLDHCGEFLLRGVGSYIVKREGKITGKLPGQIFIFGILGGLHFEPFEVHEGFLTAGFRFRFLDIGDFFRFV